MLTQYRRNRFTSRARNALLSAAIVIAAGQRVFGGTYYVDPNYSGSNGAAYNGYTGAYNSVVAALGSSGVPSGASAANPNRIYFAAGTYDTAFTTSTSLSNSRNNISLIGTTGNPADVVITSTLDSSYAGLGTTGSSTLQLKGNNVSAAGMTFANSTDTPYIVSTGHQAVTPQGNYASGTSQTASAPAAVALLLQGDQQAFTNCKFLGYQDTLYTKGGRTYFTNCYVSGDNDFIFANGTTVLKNCTVSIDGDHSGGAITAASTDKRTSNGLVFLNCNVTTNSVRGDPVIDALNAANVNGAGANSMYLGRPWGWQQAGGDASTVYINNKITGAIKAVGWLNWNANELNAANGKNGGDPSKDSRYAEYNSTDSSGANLLDVSSRVTWSHQLTASQAGAYTVAQLFATEPWYGKGFTSTSASFPGTGAASPSDPNYSWPAYWGDRNQNNDLNNESVGIFAPTFNPASYSNPTWTLGGVWDPEAQIGISIPEPGSLCLLGVFFIGLSRKTDFASSRKRIGLG